MTYTQYIDKENMHKKNIYGKDVYIIYIHGENIQIMRILKQKDHMYGKNMYIIKIKKTSSYNI